MSTFYEYEAKPALARDILLADPWFASTGINVYLDINFFMPQDESVDTLNAQVKNLFEDLGTKGLAIGVEGWQAIPIGDNVVGAIPRIIVMENPVQNRINAGGLRIQPEHLRRRIVAILLGKPERDPMQQKFRLPATGSVFEPYERNGDRFEYPIRLQITANID